MIMNELTTCWSIQVKKYKNKEDEHNGIVTQEWRDANPSVFHEITSYGIKRLATIKEKISKLKAAIRMFNEKE